MSHSVTVRHTFEAGHRLPHLNGKCQSLHGHSWQVAVTVSGPLNDAGVLVEFAALKKHLRTWVDDNLDHGLMLGKDDLLVDLLRPYGKVFVFGEDTHPVVCWPTVESVASLIASVINAHLIDSGEQARVSRCTVQETAVNQAEWTA